MENKLVILHGDSTGEEMLLDALRVIEPLGIEFVDYDLTLANRAKTKNDVVHQASAAIVKYGVGVKAATETDPFFGSPNQILRQVMNADVILRSAQRLPGIAPKAGVHYPISIVRMATGEAYGAKEWREEKDGIEYAYRTETITRAQCRSVAEYTFLLAKRRRARAIVASKWTVSSTFEAVLHEEGDQASKKYSDVEYWPLLIDALYASLVNGSATDRPLVIGCLNRDGDCLSDLVFPLFGSIAGAGSAIIAFDEKYNVQATLHEAAHGTAPTLEGQNIANPLAMILACASAVEDLGISAPYSGSDIRDAAMQTIKAGVKTRDLGGNSTMSGFTDQVIVQLEKNLN